MRKTILTILAILLTLTAVGKTEDPESERRYDHLTYLYNNDLNDSLIMQAPLDMNYYKETGHWEYYYRTWTHLVNTYTFRDATTSSGWPWPTMRWVMPITIWAIWTRPSAATTKVWS